MAKRITTIPATLNVFDATPLDGVKKRRVAGYARVSTENEEQQSSYTSQLEYYESYIKGHENWEFVGMYSDEGISGTNTKNRDGFNSMINDALSGKIDLIITKSVSRFARNTVDSLTTVRKLKEKGIEIFFEKENIWTLDSKGELLITIMSSLAQEESRSISENTTWGIRKQMAKGKVSVAYSNFLGYDKGPNGEFVINEEQAEIVRQIYRLFLAGYSFTAIKDELEKNGCVPPMGGEKWHISTIRSVLQNEKYKGDALLQKQYSTDFLTKKRKKNNGEVPQYYVEGHHPPIIEPDIFDLVQSTFRRNQKAGLRGTGKFLFSGKIECEQCGGWYGPYVMHASSKYRREYFRCRQKYNGTEKCKTPNLTEDEIKAAFIKALNIMLKNKKHLLEDLEIMASTISDTSALESRRDALIDEMNEIVKQSTTEARKGGEGSYHDLELKYAGLKEEYDEVIDKIDDKLSRSIRAKYFIEDVKKSKSIYTEFDKEAWLCFLNYATIKLNGTLVFHFRCGVDIEVDK